MTTTNGHALPPPDDDGEPKPPRKRGDKGKYFNGRLTRSQRDSLIRFAMFLLGRYAAKRELVTLLQQQSIKLHQQSGKPMSPRNCLNYIARARKRLDQLNGETPTEKRGRSRMFWLSIIRDVNANLSQKMQAQQQLDAMDGNLAPIKIANTNPDGTASPAAISQLTLNLIASEQGRDLLATLTEIQAGFTAPKSLGYIDGTEKPEVKDAGENG